MYVDVRDAITITEIYLLTLSNLHFRRHQQRRLRTTIFFLKHRILFSLKIKYIIIYKLNFSYTTCYLKIKEKQFKVHKKN